LHHDQQRQLGCHHDHQTVGPDLGETDFRRPQGQHQQMLEGAVLALADDGRSRQEHGDQSDIVDDLGDPREAVVVEIRVVLGPDHQLHFRPGGLRVAPKRGDFLGDHVLDVAPARRDLAHGCGVHIELDRGPAPLHQVAFEVRGKVHHEGVFPQVHGRIDFVDGNHFGRQGERPAHGINNAS
jgi:hypothetical protein